VEGLAERSGSTVTRRYLRRACLILGLVLGALTIGSPPALAGSHLSGWSSVDGGEIRYEDYTKYDGARTRAISAWNAVGRIHICPDDASHICDLEIDDVDDPNANYLGIAIHMIDEGATLYDVTAKLRHTNANTSRIYTQFIEKKKVKENKQFKAIQAKFNNIQYATNI
jgi:hypothetical protein